MASYTVTEPHPTVPKNSYMHSGRGGAGNMFRAPTNTTPSTGVPTHPVSAPQPTGRFYSGRGGAGNAHAASERPTLSFDEEYARADAREKASTMGHVGRGGAGNVFASVSTNAHKERKHSNASSASTSSRRDSSSTDNSSIRSGFFGRLSSHLSIGGHH
ncbi:hypothetical protein UCRPA7_1883 [Phaeoacremonium minimum UCRPA7]|uniref:Uncharacterized protein n=1 Tax=Phaeoacremonium minimum (strain UCR-PA7) TaxID=1286976 RepID=R8BTM3_PHAM7|nr:hypothetical protein UCRPA7_1883 [Phaeoacremonium minimum UCRPA7]EOO02620.1 hypothetical protein UCRPA7_1883 [Phaeoacremonium minimum UCRPA7]